VTGSVKDMKISKHKLAVMKQMQSLSNFNRDHEEAIAAANTVSAPDSASVNDSIDIAGFSSVFFVNHGAETQNYEIKTALCLIKFGEHEPQECLFSTDTVELNPGGFAMIGKS